MRAGASARWLEAAGLTLLLASLAYAAREAARILSPERGVGGVPLAVLAVLAAGTLLLVLRKALYGEALEPFFRGGSPPPWTRGDSRFLLLGWAALAALVLFVYAPLLGRGLYIADDWHLAKNAERFLARAAAGEARAGWEEILRVSGLIRPTMYALYILEWRLFGPSAAAGHAITLLYHLLSAGGLLALALYLTRARWASLAAALVWAIHPLHYGTVAFIGARSEHVYLPFYVWALAAYAAAMHGARPRRAYALCLLLLSLALGANEIAVTFPLSAFLLELFAGPRPLRAAWKGAFARLAGIAALLTLYMGIRVWRLGSGYGGHFFAHYFTAATWEKAALRLPVFYFFPMSREAVPDFPGFRSAALLGALALAAWGLARRRAPAPILFAVPFAYGAVSVLLHEVGSPETLEDSRYYYLSLWSVGLLVGFSLFGGRDAEEPPWRRAVGALALVALLHACGWTTRRNYGLWLEAMRIERGFHDEMKRMRPDGFPAGGRQYFVAAPTRAGARIPGSELNQWPPPCALLFTTPGATRDSLRIVLGNRYIGCAQGPSMEPARLAEGRWGAADFAFRWDPGARTLVDLTDALRASLAAPPAAAAPFAWDGAALARYWSAEGARGGEESGAWALATEGWGARLRSPALEADPNALGRLALVWAVDAAVPPGDRPFAVLRWTTRDAPEEHERFRAVEFDAPAGRGEATTVVDLSESIEWRTGGTVTGLRLMPINHPGRVAIRRIALEPAP